MVHKVPGHRTLLCNLKKDRKEIEVDVKNICIDAVTGWKRLTPDDISVDEISGGITNLLWKLTPKLESGLSPVVMRVFGEQTDLLIDREREKQVVLQLNQAGFGAPVLATFDNGRVEAFLDMRTLQPTDMTEPVMAARIARRLKHFHDVRMSLPGVDPSQPELYATIRKWLDMARGISYEDSAKQRAHDSVDFDSMAEELRTTEACSQRLGSPVVWSHNDLLSGNILVSKKEVGLRGEAGVVPSMQFIDFEYGAYAPRGFDWGNHLNEYAGFECAYGRYPDAAHVSAFARAYLTEGAEHPPSDEDVAAAAAEANFFALVSHQYWGIWSLIQARHSPIDFDYFQYSRLRWDEYHRRKAEFLGGLEATLKQSGAQE